MVQLTHPHNRTSSPPCNTPYKPALLDHPFHPGRKQSGPISALMQVIPALCTPNPVSAALLTLGPGGPAAPWCPVAPWCPAWRGSHWDEGMCRLSTGHCDHPEHPQPCAHPVVPRWPRWSHRTGHPWGSHLPGAARAPWHAWQSLLTLLTLPGCSTRGHECGAHVAPGLRSSRAWSWVHPSAPAHPLGSVGGKAGTPSEIPLYL